MEDLIINSTHSTPEVTFSNKNGLLKIVGICTPENPKTFFTPIVDWVKDYAKEPNKETVVTFKMEYINSASQKKIHDIILICKEIHERRVPIFIDWYYHQEDEGMKEEGETLSELVKIPFRFFVY